MDINVRNVRDTDLDALVELYNRYIAETAVTFDLSPYTTQQRRESWLSHYSDSGRHRLLVAECDRQIVGYATSSKFATKAAYDTSVETSIYVALGFTGSGIGRQLYSTLFDMLKTEDVHRAYAGITLPNEASVAIHRKFGFEQVAIFQEVGRKFDRYWDVAWFQKNL
ncbi:MAG: N-acetyltransferase family protein [Phormidesmis sp.]